MRIRRARPAEGPAIHALVAGYAGQGLLLPRTPEQIHAAIGDFLVALHDGRVVGCAGLEFYGPRRGGLAEVRSLAVAPEARSSGLGGRLLEAAVKQARSQGVGRVFAVTRDAEFFERHAFARVPGGIPDEKVARDCGVCPKAAGCRLQALSRDLAPAQSPQMLPVLTPGRLRREPAPA
jgi:amino-acid N-acetyltransferase